MPLTAILAKLLHSQVQLFTIWHLLLLAVIKGVADAEKSQLSCVLAKHIPEVQATLAEDALLECGAGSPVFL